MSFSQQKISIATINLALLDIHFFGISIVKPAQYIKERLLRIPDEIKKQNVDILALQEIYKKEDQDFLIESLKKNIPSLRKK